MTKTTTEIEKFQYDHIFNLILGIFKFNEKKYGNFVKDVIRILLDFEKNGETIIDVDNSLIIFELLEDGWPNKHIDVLKNIGLIGSLNSPFILVNRKLSLSKWSKKIERVKSYLSSLIKFSFGISTNFLFCNSLPKDKFIIRKIASFTLKAKEVSI